jgi:glycosyltransferase involved in cell wall biosynthesis
VLEAMACGTPVITSDLTSLPEVGGDAALLVSPHDHEALAEAMHRCAFDPGLREEMRERGIEHATRFSWKRTAEQTVEIYKKVLEVV